MRSTCPTWSSGVVLYLITGFGITVGFHRLFTHRAFGPRRALKIALAVMGSMAVEGSLTSWVATHRRHHMFSDQPGDPHSPHRYGDHGTALLRGLAFSHVGWLFVSDASSATRYAPDMLRDPDIQRIDRLFPVLAVALAGHPSRHRLRAVGHPGRGAHRAAVGRAGPHGPPPPRDLVGQLAVPHLRPATRGDHRPQHQSVGAGRGVPRGQLAQHPPRPPVVGTPRGTAGAWSTRRPGSSGASSRWAGPPGCGGPRRPPAESPGVVRSGGGAPCRSTARRGGAVGEGRRGLTAGGSPPAGGS